jgi:hypothetical protein
MTAIAEIAKCVFAVYLEHILYRGRVTRVGVLPALWFKVQESARLSRKEGDRPESDFIGPQ